jgi:3-hydroxyacyl-CoA dehydrogenase/uncharacterized OB-fold protein
MSKHQRTSLHPAPVRTTHDEPFWQATGRGKLLIKDCTACNLPHWYPRPHCPFCGSMETRWREATGRGRIYSFSIMSKAPRPTAVAVVELEEGPKVTTIIVEADVQRMNIDDPVTVRFEPAEDGSMIPVFTTLAAEEARTYAATTLASATAHAELRDVEPIPVTDIAVVGAGNMGIGISKALLAGGYPITLIDPDAAARDRAHDELTSFALRRVERGDVETPPFTIASDLQAASTADLVIEAVWEDFALKQQVFNELDAIMRPTAILATNTSTLDINALAQGTAHPNRVIGMHFFSPAHIMRLVEIVRAASTDTRTLATAIQVANQLGKTPVVVGVCPGFAANRMMIARNRAAEELLLEGALPDQVDRVMRSLGLPMGPFEMLDMGGGIEVNVRRRQATGEVNWIFDALFARGRLGQKTGQGFYRYDMNDRTPRPDPEVEALIVLASEQAGVTRRYIADAEIRQRLVDALQSEGRAIVDERIVSREGDLDVIWREGFGWPEWSGGPMYLGSQGG